LEMQCLSMGIMKINNHTTTLLFLKVHHNSLLYFICLIIIIITVKVSFLARERDLSFRSVPYRTISYRDRDRDHDRDRDRDRLFIIV
jgi:hypothetical protein